MQTETKTYTKVDIRKVWECFSADLSMLVSRTKTMSERWASDVAHDITLMAIWECLSVVHIQLLNRSGERIAAHRYDVKGAGNWGQDSPGGNNWPNADGGEIVVNVTYSDKEVIERLQRDGKLRRKWSPARTPSYSGMKTESLRQYSSGSYGLERRSFSA